MIHQEKQRELSSKYTKYCRPDVGKLLERLNMDKVYVEAKGDYLFYVNADGEKIPVLDFLGGYGASLFGHNNPELIKTAQENLEFNLPFNSQMSIRSQAARLCEELNSIANRKTGKGYVTTLANSGAEAVEAALKHAELFQHNKITLIKKELKKINTKIQQRPGANNITFSPALRDFLLTVNEPGTDKNLKSVLDEIYNFNEGKLAGKPTFLCLSGSFHGKTTGALQLTYNNDYREPFSRLGNNAKYISPEDIGELEESIREATIIYFKPFINSLYELDIEPVNYVNIPAIFIEPIQGEGGIRQISAEYFIACRELANENGIHLVIDEIQSGMGRTGTFFASEQQNVIGDYYLLSKSLGGGLAKIAAVMIDDTLYQDEFGLIHTSTFAEDDHSSRIALKTLEIIERDSKVYDNAQKQGAFIVRGLTEIKNEYPDVIDDIKGVGLMIGIKFVKHKWSGSVTLQMLSNQNLLGYVIAGYLLNEYDIRVAPTLSSNSTIRLEPSAYILEEHCQKLFHAVRKVCEIISKQNVYHLLKFTVGGAGKDNFDEVENYYRKPSVVEGNADVRKVAFMSYLVTPELLVNMDASFALFSAEQKKHVLEKFHDILDPDITEDFLIRSKTGEMIRFYFIAYMISSELIKQYRMKKDYTHLMEKIEKGVAIAEENGCEVMGFGGFLSIVTNNCKNLHSDSVFFTSGNSFTVATGMEAITSTAIEHDIDIRTATLAVVGATGNICSVYSEMMAEKVPNVILLSSTGKEKLMDELVDRIYQNALDEILSYENNKNEALTDVFPEGIAGAIYDSKSLKYLLQHYENIDEPVKWLRTNIDEEFPDTSPVLVSSDLKMLKKANLIITASNSVERLIFPEMLSEDKVVICDIAVPRDTDNSVKDNCVNVKVIEGGIVRLPHNPDFSIRGDSLAKGNAWACVSETILLGFLNKKEHYSYGKIQKDKVIEIANTAKKHGLKLSMASTKKYLID